MSSITRRSMIASGLAITGLTAMGLAAFNQAQAAEEETIWEPTKTTEADVIVVGAGSGLWGAYTAAEAGLNVVVVEKSASCLNSNTNWMRGTTAADTNVQKELGIDCPLDTVYAAMMDFAKGTVNSVLVRKCLAASTDVINTWADLGCEISVASSDLYGIGFLSVHTYSTENKLGLVESALIDKGVQFDYNTEAKELIVENGRVVGLYADGPDGQVEYRAKAVILACGGFMDNDEMMRSAFGDQIKLGRYSYAVNDGAGIKMTLAAGGIMETNFCMSTLANNAGFNEKCEGVFENYMQSDKRSQALAFDVYGTLHVDQNGDRFINEYDMAKSPLTIAGAAEMRLGYYYAIADQKMVNTLLEHSAFDRVGRPDYWIPGPLTLDNPCPRMQEDIDAAIEQGWAWKAETPEELAEIAGLPNLASTIERYNGFCADGYDSDLNLPKEFLIALDEGPYYAIQYQVGGLNTMGGVRTDNSCRAVNAELKPIPGLYIGSSDNGSVFAAPYYNVGGSCNAMCMATSWVAGQTAAEDIAANA